MRKLSIIIPTYEEKENIRLLVKRIETALFQIDHEILFVDDSKDDTTQIIESIAQKNPRVKLIHRTGKLGLSSAVLLGFEMAEGEYLACMDADLQHPPETLLPMYVAMETGADFCLASRFIKGGNDGGLPLFRKIVSGTARRVGWAMIPSLRRISDPTGGFFMVRKAVVKTADLRPLGWKILIELLATARYRRIIEIPYAFADRNAGRSKISCQTVLAYLQQCRLLQKRGRCQQKVIVKRWSREKIKEMLRSYEKVRLKAM